MYKDNVECELALFEGRVKVVKDAVEADPTGVITINSARLKREADEAATKAADEEVEIVKKRLLQEGELEIKRLAREKAEKDQEILQIQKEAESTY